MANAARENGVLAVLVFGVVLLAGVFAWWMSLAPNPLPADAPPDAFSAYRALEHVKQMASESHPAGSHANEKVYDYIAAQLKAMDVEMTVERPILAYGNTIDRSGAILARVPGTDSTGAFAMDAHIDSTPYGPGAADIISGCAAMLETIRALKASPPLKNDILFCFSDKEEGGGTSGPHVFINHPWYKDVRAMLGLESRGSAGPALMFETGQDNGFMIRQLAQSDVKANASSIMFDFYDRMPFGSNFTRYKNAGTPGLNIAFIDRFAYYHTKLDSPENLSLASQQHSGDYTLGLARQLGSVSLEDCRAPNAIYFNTIGSHMVVYPGSWGKWISLAAGALFVVVLLIGLAGGRLTIGGVFAGMGVYLLAAVLSLIILIPLCVLVYFQFHEHALYRNNSLSAGQILIGIGILVLVARLVRNRVRPQSFLAGALVWQTLALAAIQYFAPYGSFSAAWPLAFTSVGLLLLCLSRNPERPSNVLLVAAALTTVPGVILVAPSYVVFSYAVTALMVPALTLVILQIIATLLPQTSLIPAKAHTVVGMALFVAGILVFTGACVTNTPSPDRPRQNCLSYAVNFDTSEAWWISSDAKLDEWTKNFFGENTPRVPRGALEEFLGPGHRSDDTPRYRKAAAPMPPFGKTVLNVIEDRVENGRRKLKLFVDSPCDAQEVTLRLESETPVYKAKAFGLDVESADKNWQLRLNTVPFEGGEIEIETDPDKPLRFLVHEESYALPDIPGFQPRPAYMMTEPNRVLERRNKIPSNHTYTVCTYTF